MRRSPTCAIAAGIAVALVLLVAAPAASAHRGSPASVASDYEARSLALRPSIPGLSAHATGGDIDLVLHVPPGREVVVLGAEGEPFLRFAGGRVFANEHSPTVAAEHVMRLTGDLLEGPPLWHELRRGRTFHWHEGRLRPRPSSRDGLVAHIAIPLRVDGARVVLVGSSWHARGPGRLAWLVPLIVALAAGAALLRRRALVRPRLVQSLALVAIVSVLASSIGTTLYAPHSTLVGGALLVGLAVAPASQRAFIALGAGGLCVLYAASVFPLLTDGFALSRLPTDLARTLEALALVGGALLALVGAMQISLLTSRLDAHFTG